MRGPLRTAAVTAAVATLAGSALAGGGPARAAAPGPRAASGAQLWAARFTASGLYQFSVLTVSPRGGRVFVAGGGYGGRATGTDYQTVAYSAAGRQLWSSRYSGPGRQEDDPEAVTVSPDGRRVFVTGDAAGWGTGYDTATVAYSAATGKQLWATHYNGYGKGDDGAAGVVVSPDGRTVFVTGTSEGRRTDAGNTDFVTVAYSAATGRRLWVSRYTGPGDLDAAQSVAVSPGGATVFVTGGSNDRTDGYDNYATIAYRAATGRQLWASRYHGPGNGYGEVSTVAVSPDGRRVFVTGYTKGRRTGYDYATVAYWAATGRRLWVSRYNGYRNRFDGATALAVSPSGGTVFVTGTSDGRKGTDYATIAYRAATGKRLWVSRYRHGYQANSVTVSPSGTTVYVTGNGDGDYGTVAYRAATGRQLWASRYANGAGSSVAVSPSGTTVYVTGNIQNRTTDAYATIAYRG